MKKNSINMSMIDENTEVVETNPIQDGRPEQEDIHTQKTVGECAVGTPGACSKQGARSRTKTKTSYLRPNRDYTKHMTWSYDLNRDIYNIHKEAIEPNQKGYMKRMKELWDKTHSKYNHLTEKHLRKQALRVINKKLIKETGLITNEAEQTTRADNEEKIDQPVEINKDNIEQNGSLNFIKDIRSNEEAVRYYNYIYKRYRNDIWRCKMCLHRYSTG